MSETGHHDLLAAHLRLGEGKLLDRCDVNEKVEKDLFLVPTNLLNTILVCPLVLQKFEPY